MATGVAMMVVDVALGNGDAEGEAVAVASVLGVVMLIAKNIAAPLAKRIAMTPNRLERKQRRIRITRVLHVHMHRTPTARCVEVLHEPLRTGGLARLAPSVQREVLVIVDELQHAAKPPLGRKHVVIDRIARTSRVERGAHATTIVQCPEGRKASRKRVTRSERFVRMSFSEMTPVSGRATRAPLAQSSTLGSI